MLLFVGAAVTLAGKAAGGWLGDRFGRRWVTAACEGVVLAAEWGMLCAVYRDVSRFRLLGIAATMNAASYVTGLAL